MQSGLLKDATADDPIRGTKWTRKSLRQLVKELCRQKFQVSHETVRRLLKTLHYSPRRNRGFIGVGVSHETAKFAVNVIRCWWWTAGRSAYPGPDGVLIQADGGGANGYRSWLWKWELQRLADETGLTITITHYPTSASKWNWIEHRLFCHISANWAGEPLVSHETVLKFIRTTTTETGWRCCAYLDQKVYATQIKITPEQQDSIRLKRLHVLPKWNYTIRPRYKAV